MHIPEEFLPVFSFYQVFLLVFLISGLLPDFQITRYFNKIF